VSKTLGIDYGSKRIGVAISDSLGIIASALDTVPNKEIFTFLTDLFKNENIDCIVVGEARNLDGKKTNSSRDIKLFIDKLQKKYPKTIIKTIDERFTSKIAFQSMIDAGVKKKERRKKDLINKVSAVIILQDYLSYK